MAYRSVWSMYAYHQHKHSDWLQHKSWVSIFYLFSEQLLLSFYFPIPRSYPILLVSHIFVFSPFRHFPSVYHFLSLYLIPPIWWYFHWHLCHLTLATKISNHKYLYITYIMPTINIGTTHHDQLTMQWLAKRGRDASQATPGGGPTFPATQSSPARRSCFLSDVQTEQLLLVDPGPQSRSAKGTQVKLAQCEQISCELSGQTVLITVALGNSLSDRFPTPHKMDAYFKMTTDKTNTETLMRQFGWQWAHYQLVPADSYNGILTFFSR